MKCDPKRHLIPLRTCILLIFLFSAAGANAQQPPYDIAPEAKPPYYRVRYEAKQVSELIFPVQYTVWIPDVEVVRGIVIHQHGCGEGSCKSGLTGAYDLHWQALAEKHGCALLSPSYEQPQSADCQMWCDPRNGSAKALDRALKDLGQVSGHEELSAAPLALWGHSGGGHWCGGMVMTQPERIVAAWLRSGVPLFEANPDRPSIQVHTLPNAALQVPMMCNPGTKEGVTVTEGRFASVWPANLAFFDRVRGIGGLLGVAIDPLTAHECGNSRYLAIPWLDHCLTMRLPEHIGAPLRKMPETEAWLANPTGSSAVPQEESIGDPLQLSWLPNQKLAEKWMQFRIDTRIADTSPPPAPTIATKQGNHLVWSASSDLESGVAKFIILRDGVELAEVTGEKNRYGRQLFQGLQYSDTPALPLKKMRFTDESAELENTHQYAVVTVNTVGGRSEPTIATATRVQK